MTLKITNGMQCRPSNVVLCLFIDITVRIQGLRIQDSGFRKRAVNHSVMTTPGVQKMDICSKNYIGQIVFRRTVWA